MDMTILGRTGLEVGVAGLGAGGGAQLGLRNGASRAEAVGIVRLALDLGVNLIDTANMYGTEDVVGEAIRGHDRDGVVISTKAQISRRGAAPRAADEVVGMLDRSLQLLGTDHIDIFHVHGLYPANYDHAVETILPALERERAKGKFRFYGATEYAQADHEHAALARLLDADLADVVMVAFSMINQNARQSVFPRTMAKNVGTLLMFVARNLFGFPARLETVLARLAADGKLPEAALADAEPLGFLIHDGGAVSLIDAAYRYARYEPGAHVVLFGTGDPGHLRANIASLNRPPLPEADRARIDALFASLVGVGVEPGFSHAEVEAATG